MYHYYLDRCEEVEWYYYEPFAIDYYLDDKIHSYIPDFLVKINNDKILYQVIGGIFLFLTCMILIYKIIQEWQKDHTGRRDNFNKNKDCKDD